MIRPGGQTSGRLANPDTVYQIRRNDPTGPPSFWRTGFPVTYGRQIPKSPVPPAGEVGMLCIPGSGAYAPAGAGGPRRPPGGAAPPPPPPPPAGGGGATHPPHPPPDRCKGEPSFGGFSRPFLRYRHRLTGFFCMFGGSFAPLCAFFNFFSQKTHSCIAKDAKRR